MTTCVPIKLGGVRTHRLVMRVMCWQPGKTGVLKKTKMEKKEFQSSFSDYRDTSNCGLETERRTESGKGFEAYIYDENIRVINRNAHSATITDIIGTQATGSELNDEILYDLRGIVKGHLSCFFNKCSLYGYTYSKDHKFLMVSNGSEIVNRDDLDNICKYATNGEMTPVIMRSIITFMDRDEVSVRMFDLMVEYAMG